MEMKNEMKIRIWTGQKEKELILRRNNKLI